VILLLGFYLLAWVNAASTLLFLLFTFHVIIFSYFNKLPKAREGQGEGHFEMVKDIEGVGGKESGRQ
jgi:hypothetical protein